MEEASEHAGDSLVMGWRKNPTMGHREWMDENCFTQCFTGKGEK